VRASPRAVIAFLEAENSRSSCSRRLRARCGPTPMPSSIRVYGSWHRTPAPTISTPFTDLRLPEEQRLRGVRAIGTLYDRLLAKRCSHHLSHLGEAGAGALNPVCYMLGHRAPAAFPRSGIPRCRQYRGHRAHGGVPCSRPWRMSRERTARLGRESLVRSHATTRACRHRRFPGALRRAAAGTRCLPKRARAGHVL